MFACEQGNVRVETWHRTMVSLYDFKSGCTSFTRIRLSIRKPSPGLGYTRVKTGHVGFMQQGKFVLIADVNRDSGTDEYIVPGLPRLPPECSLLDTEDIDAAVFKSGSGRKLGGSVNVSAG